MNFTTTALAAGTLMTIFIGVPITTFVSQYMEILATFVIFGAVMSGAFALTPKKDLKS